MMRSIGTILIFISFFQCFLAGGNNTAHDFESLKHFADSIKALNHKDPICSVRLCGKGWGAHRICYSPVPKDMQCRFLSFGVSYDWSFDTQMHNEYGCEGFALDPTVDLPVKLTPGVIFLKAGANTRLDISSKWSMFSPVELQKFVQQPLYILKMDCEGCEYVIARDVLQYDPYFFHNVYQFNVEVHTPRSFLNDSIDARGLGKLYHLLLKAGLQLVHNDGGRCGPIDQVKGCLDALIDSGFPCEPGCQSFLFGRNETFVAWRRRIMPNN